MKASYRWLRALLPGLELTPTEVAERLTRGGLQVEQLLEYGAGTRDLVVARIVRHEPHPSRPRLKLVTVDRGGGQQQRIVCGAPNVPEAGGLVALAPLGATLPAAGITLTAREIGGVVSEGMLCSEMELGLVPQRGAGHDQDPGILILPNDLTPGTPLREAVPAVHDHILDISVTPNRPDALGHVGIARDLAALLGVPFRAPAPNAPARVAGGEIGDLVSVTIEDTERCPHYGAAAVVDVTIGPSPAWVRYRLESLGIRAISNVVDVTNLILLEFAHPMHAFDLEKVRGKRIDVRRARPGEKLETLDGVSRALDPDDLVIADGEGSVALAGVMGGAGSEIAGTTKRVLLECAYFWPRGIRRASRRHGLHTESSHRFERGVDPGGVPDVLAHAASLLTHLCGGSAVKGTILAGVPLATPKAISLRGSRMRALVGADIPLAEAATTLTRLGFRVSGSSEGSLEAQPPTHRPDVTLEADLIEEVLRVHGLDSVPTVLPAIRPQPPRATGVLSGRVRRAAIDVGLSEALTFGFCAPRELEALGAPPPAVTLKNPLTEERSVMRTSLLPGLLEALRRARRHGVEDVRLFALGARFLSRTAGSPAGDPRLPDELPSFAAVIAGRRHATLAKPADVDVYDAKGVVVEIAERALRRRVSVRQQPEGARAPHLHPRAAGEVLVGDVVIGAFGPLHPEVAQRLDLDGVCVVCELDLRAMATVGAALPRFAPIPVLPAATRDVALVVRDEVTAGDVEAAIRSAAAELCESVELFDLFRGGSIPADHRSLAYHVVYRDPKASTDPEHARTLTDEEVDTRHKAVLATVNAKFGAVLRA